MHPYISQALVTARISDRHREAAAARQARQARQAMRAGRAGRRGSDLRVARTAAPLARDGNLAAGRALGQPDRLRDLALARGSSRPHRDADEAESPVACGASR